MKAIIQRTAAVLCLLAASCVIPTPPPEPDSTPTPEPKAKRAETDLSAWERSEIIRLAQRVQWQIDHPGQLQASPTQVRNAALSLRKAVAKPETLADAWPDIREAMPSMYAIPQEDFISRLGGIIRNAEFLITRDKQWAKQGRETRRLQERSRKAERSPGADKPKQVPFRPSITIK